MSKFMHLSLLGVFVLVAFVAKSEPRHYEDPPNACYEGCTPWMENLLSDFETKSDLLKLEPAVYSGECHHLSQSYDADHTHYAVVMIDQNAKGEFYFSTQFVFFAEENEYASWNLETARAEMSDYWKENGNLKFGKLSTRVEINYDDGNPAYIYWMRQNPQSNELYYITYAGVSMKSFCRLTKN